MPSSRVRLLLHCTPRQGNGWLTHAPTLTAVASKFHGNATELQLYVFAVVRCCVEATTHTLTRTLASAWAHAKRCAPPSDYALLGAHKSRARRQTSPAWQGARGQVHLQPQRREICNA
eukprot:2203079-Alexandrium_andersonii.AAC.2